MGAELWLVDVAIEVVEGVVDDMEGVLKAVEQAVGDAEGVPEYVEERNERDCDCVGAA